MWIVWWWWCCCAVPTVLWVACYFGPLVYILIRGPQNLRKKYDATWALVTGGSTGIGRAIVEALAKQGLNVVVCGLPDDFMEPTMRSLRETYGAQQFIACPVSFAPGADYLAKIKKATEGVDVQLVFNNAGFIVTGFFDTQPLGKLLVNVECNATASVAITHHFAAAMLRKGLKGCVVYTSSASAYIPNPFAITYGATKAFMSQFAASIAVELQPKGVDVCVVHPSPVASNFYANVQHKIDSMEQFKKVAVAPSKLPDTIFAAVGRVVLLDVGATAILMRLFVAVLPYNFLASLIAFLAPVLPDYVQNDSNRGSGGQRP
ncbi:hypothetical protein CTAYLR_000360 [Chrysophaeum taylorii]|uniref:Uncharacterized protein n=1 Tax=Chrysophaeum taylorii TaxID=2483200 RepID=A0AAD7XMW8_9STRA|nr:hypothetical protein CTAYLR_000360 [Chrysophaeum taylorii]